MKLSLKIMSTLTQARLAPLTQRYLSIASWRYDLRERIPSGCKRSSHLPKNVFEGLLNRNVGRFVSLPKLCKKDSYFFGNTIIGNYKIHTVQASNNTRYTYRNSQHINENDDEKFHPEDEYDIRSLATMLGIMGLFKQATTSDIEEESVKLTDEQKIEKMKPIELLIARGVLCMCDQDYSKANNLFHEALHLAQDENDDEKENLILNLLASNFFESGDFEKAEKLFIDLMKTMIARSVEPTAPPILELSLKLASIYSKNPATHDKALKGFKFVINSLLLNLEDVLNNLDQLDDFHELSEEKKDELALLGWSYDWFAKHLLAMNDYNGASDMLQRALKISSKVLGPLHDQTLILLNDVGTTLAMNNAPEEGRMFIKKAVEGAIENQSQELASFYVNLGLVYLKLRKLNEAKRYCEYSLELAGKNREHHNSHEVIELSRSCLNEVERLMELEEQK